MRRGENLLRRGDRWCFRCRVPGELVSIIGRREVVLTLRTGDRDVARYLAAAIRPRIGRWWVEAARMAAGGKEQHLIAELLRQRFTADLDKAFAQYVEASGDPEYDRGLTIAAEENALSVTTEDASDRALTGWIDAASGMLEHFGYQAGPADQRTRVLARHLVELSGLIADASRQWHEGRETFRPKFPALPPELFPAPKTRQQGRNEEKRSEPPEPKHHTPVPVDTLVEGWIKENKKGPKLAYEARRIVRTMVEVVGKDDAALITPEDAVRWKEKRMETVATLTMRREVSQCSVVWKWGKANRKITFAENPFSGIAPNKPRGGSDRPVRPFTDDEAATILRAARLETKPWLRWLPWVAAYTGARLGEICHARKEDVREVSGVMVLDIHHEREFPLKTPWSMRMVPLHPDLIAEGFLTYVASLPAGAVLFPGIKQDMHGDRAGVATKKIGWWFRKTLAIEDDRLSPSHSWRHLFADRRRLVDMPNDTANALERHEEKGGGEAKNYGDGLRGKPWKTAEWMNRMPSILPPEPKTDA